MISEGPTRSFDLARDPPDALAETFARIALAAGPAVMEEYAAVRRRRAPRATAAR